MSTHAFIDESGTLVEHKIMTVSLVLLEGRRSAERICQRILKELYPHLAHDPKALNRKQMHFADMPDSTQNQVARHLAAAKISAVINSHWHSGEDETHQILFTRYTKMVQLLIYRALEATTGDLTVIIAEQGSPESYRTIFFSDLQKTVDLYRRRSGQFRAVDFDLKSTKTVRGLQLADFYAGTVRKMWLESSNGAETHVCTPYRHVQNQITLENYIDLE
jgi:hypothetical protein